MGNFLNIRARKSSVFGNIRKIRTRKFHFREYMEFFGSVFLVFFWGGGGFGLDLPQVSPYLATVNETFKFYSFWNKC